jgi:hypothetical protein
MISSEQRQQRNINATTPTTKKKNEMRKRKERLPSASQKNINLVLKNRIKVIFSSIVYH